MLCQLEQTRSPRRVLGRLYCDGYFEGGRLANNFQIKVTI